MIIKFEKAKEDVTDYAEKVKEDVDGYATKKMPRPEKADKTTKS
ncbi:MAG: hypothetical protein RBS23_06790 [Mariniphaga sp.]|nr:hypothetical protein [Mariniphaga sp.]